MRLDKYLSESTAYSRKDVRGLIKRKAITVNGIEAEAKKQGKYYVVEIANISAIPTQIKGYISIITSSSTFGKALI